MLAEGIERLATVISRMLNEEANGLQNAGRSANRDEGAESLW